MTEPADLGEVLADWTEVGKATARLSERNQRGLRITAISLIFMFLLSVGMVYAIARVNNVVESQVQRDCEQTNRYRASDKQLWTYLLAIQPEVPRTPSEELTRVEFQKFLNEHDAPLRC